MYVHRSNRAETLVAELATLVARPLAGAFAPECIVVQGRGMERWLSMELARHLGVWANPDFPFPRRLIERALAAVLGPQEPGTTCFRPEVLMWSIADLLRRFADRPQFTPIRHYLADDDSGIRRIQLAERIADVFDQYVVYRPDLVVGWDHNGGTDWQGVLWHALVQRHGPHHIAARARAFLSTLRAVAARREDFPARVSIFGVSTLPPLYLNLFAALSPWVELHLFVLSPTREYWGDIRSRREVLRRAAKQPAATVDLATALQAETNPLLASLGRQGREFQQVLEACGDYQEDDRDLYRDPDTTSMLATVQADILNLRQRAANGDVSPLLLDPNDDSIRVHACHGAMREVEVLHDQLLALFDQDPTLEPRDVVVMSPAVDTYAPFIDAVFGRAGGDRPRIPYRIADRHVRATEVVFDAFARLLDVLRGRFAASDVLDLLGNAVIGSRFGIAAEELDLVRAWVAASGIRWGADAAHRREVGQPALSENTWRFGLDRMLLGYAMPGEGRLLYGGVLPYDDIEGTTADLLGRLADFCEKLFAFRSALRHARPIVAWRDDLGALLDSMLASSDATAYQHQRIRSALAELAHSAQHAGFDEPVEIDTVRRQLEQTLERTASARGFLSGGVTFCAMVPMRTIPFRVICLLGMNDDGFPRIRRPLGFDLIAQQPRPGDRSSRDDDRYLFLEALLAARERLIITYIGQSIRDNADLPPSVVVSELLDVLEESFTVAPPHTAVVDAIRTRHPLQPFSPRYFTGEDARLFSYAATACAGARSLVAPRYSPPIFISHPLPPERAAVRVVALDDLVRFFDNPARAFLQRRLGLYLGADARVGTDREPIALDTLAQWQIGTDLLARALDNEDLDAAFVAIKATGTLPLGTPGRCLYDDLAPSVRTLAAAAAPLRATHRLDPVVIDGEIAATRIAGVIRTVWPTGQLEQHYSKLGGRSELQLWIRHVILNWAAPPSVPRASILIGRPTDDDGTIRIRFRPLADPAPILEQLLRLYWLGQSVPLPFFPRTSRAYAEALRHANGSARSARTAAQKQFEPGPHAPFPGEGENPYVQQVFGSGDPLGPDSSLVSYPGFATLTFAELACAVFQPLLEHREEER